MTVTFDRTYVTADKSDWGDGPWQDEPDKAQWVDLATDLDCLIVRSFISGSLCGYVGVPKSHPWFGLDYADCTSGEHEKPYCDDCPAMRMSVHGGLNFAATCDEGPESLSICHVPLPGRSDKVWWFGFDCAHMMDHQPAAIARMHSVPEIREKMMALDARYPAIYKPLAYVQSEVTKLAEQLAAVAS